MIEVPNIFKLGLDNLNVDQADVPAPATLILKPERVFICAQNGLQFATFLRFPLGELQLVNGLAYVSSNPSVLEINAADGSATVLAAGMVTVSVTWQGQRATATVTVLGMGSSCCDAVVVGYAVAIDNSLSMSAPLTNSESKLDAAKEIAAAFLEEIRTLQDHAGVYEFGTAPMLIDGAGQAEPSAALTDLSALDEVIADLEAGSFGQRVLLVLSDGQQSAELTKIEQIRAWDEFQSFKKGGGIIICIGLAASGLGFDALQHMATAGFFINIPRNDFSEVVAAANDAIRLMGYYCGGGRPVWGEGYTCGPYGPYHCSDVPLQAQQAADPETDTAFIEDRLKPKFIAVATCSRVCPGNASNIQQLVPVMTGYSTPTGLASASSEAPGFPAWAAFGGTGWRTQYGATSGKLQYQFDASSDIIAYAITALPTNYGGALELDSPVAWTFEGSNDGVSWTVLDSQSGMAWAPGQRKRFEIANLDYWAYYRLNISGNNGGAAVGVLNFELFGNDNLASVATVTEVSDVSQRDAEIKAQQRANAIAQSRLNCQIIRLNGPAMTSAVVVGGTALFFSVPGSPSARIRFTVGLGATPPPPNFDTPVSANMFEFGSNSHVLTIAGIYTIVAVARATGYADSLPTTQAVVV